MKNSLGYEVDVINLGASVTSIHYFWNSSLVRFRMEGNAEIVTVDNASLMSSEPYNESFIHLYQGIANVLRRWTGAEGNITVLQRSWLNINFRRNYICLERGIMDWHFKSFDD